MKHRQQSAGDSGADQNQVQWTLSDAILKTENCELKTHFVFEFPRFTADIFRPSASGIFFPGGHARL